MSRLLAGDEAKPFTIVNGNADTRWIVTCDHASKNIPRALGTLGLPESDIARHIGWDIGAAAVARGLAARLNAWTILQRYSRLVIDCNRPPGVASAIPLRSENTDIPGNIGISAEQAAQRRDEIFEPYHAAIAMELDRRAIGGQPSILVAMHSFTPIYDNIGRTMHAAVLYHRDARLARALFDRLAAEPGLVIGDNDPYRVSDETDYGIPVHAERRGLPYVEFEMRQDLITSPDGQAEWIDRLARLLPVAARDAEI